ncbi:hypothetical protein R1A27_24205 [Methylobacterium sp. NMS12]|uniref:hypothetical protein n=1 Tax=Methylobacterium sp. NMS12 TaxID=3079766 RepID=UPI003F885AEA
MTTTSTKSAILAGLALAALATVPGRAEARGFGHGGFGHHGGFHHGFHHGGSTTATITASAAMAGGARRAATSATAA